MSTRLPLSSLEVEGYRAIQHVRIEKLAQVNLFVGKNNVGKTSLLEAIRLYVSRTPRAVLADLIADKGDYRTRISTRGPRYEVTVEELEAVAEEAEAFFHGSFSGSSNARIRIGPAGLSGDVLTISLPWAESARQSGASGRIGSELFIGPDSPLFEIDKGGDRAAIPFDLLLRRIPLARPLNRADVLFVSAGGLEPDRLAALWDRAAAAGKATEVEHALRSIVPDLDRVYLVGERGSARRRSVVLGLRGAARAVPLLSMGDGVNRVFGIALALVQTQGGVVLIDEVENGLHYSVQEEVWRAILTLAHELGVQVFATTHSWDGIQAFAAASNESVEVDGMLHRLENRGLDKLRVVELTEEDLAIVSRQRIEVR
jgi:predicted ATPase